MTEGVDVSNHQQGIGWARVAGAGVQFALIKATEGVAFSDAYYSANVAGARAVGILPGCYHYGRTENDPEVEARFHLDVAVSHLRPGDLLALDIEEASPGADVAAWSLAWLAVVEAATGCRPLVYSFPSFVHRYLTDPALAAYPLWLASWQIAEPTVPGPWTAYAIWQYSSQATVAGIAGHADVNRTPLDVAGLQALGLPGLAGTTPPTVDPVDAALEREYQREAAMLGGKRFAATVDRPYYAGKLLVAERGLVGPTPADTAAIRQGATDDLLVYLESHNVLTRL